MKLIEEIKKNSGLQELNETLSSGIYRFISINDLERLLKTNTFSLALAAGANKLSNKFYFLSLSRNKYGGFARANTGKEGVTLVLDSAKFNTKFKSKSVDYWGKAFSTIAPEDVKKMPPWKKEEYLERKLKNDENEERILSDKNTIPNALSYVKAIHVLAPEDEVYQSKFKDLKNAATMKKIPLYIYTDKKAWELHDTRRQLKTFKEVKPNNQRLQILIDIYNGTATDAQKQDIARSTRWGLDDFMIGLENDMTGYKSKSEAPLIQKFTDIKIKSKVRDTKKFIEKIIIPKLD